MWRGSQLFPKLDLLMEIKTSRTVIRLASELPRHFGLGSLKSHVLHSTLHLEATGASSNVKSEPYRTS